MKKEQISIEAKELMKVKNQDCLSVLIPLHHNPSQNQTDRLVVDKAMKNVRILLDSKFESSERDKWLAKALEMKEQIRFTDGWSGAGIFISPQHASLIAFSIKPKEKVVLRSSFEIRELLYRDFFERKYLVMRFSMDKAVLWKGQGNSLKQVQSVNFPLIYADDYEFDTPSVAGDLSSSLKQYEKDRSIVKEIRLESFLHRMDEKLDSYLDKNTPLIISAVEKDISYYEKTSRHKNNIAGKVEGNFQDESVKIIQERAMEQLASFRQKEQNKMVTALRETDPAMLASGIHNVWRDAKLGKGHMLVLERDFAKPGFLGDDELNLMLFPPPGDHRIIIDAVDEAIETVLEKNGEIIFVDNGKLEEFEGVAMLKRFP